MLGLIGVAAARARAARPYEAPCSSVFIRGLLALRLSGSTYRPSSGRVAGEGARLMSVAGIVGVFIEQGERRSPLRLSARSLNRLGLFVSFVSCG